MNRLALTLMALVLSGCATTRPAAPNAAPAAPSPPSPAPPPATPTAPAVPVAPPPTPPTPTPQQPLSTLREVFPHIRADIAAGLIEIDAVVPIDAHNDATPRVYLEVVLCSTDTKEHEALAMTQARPSHVHAALLLLGLQPGTPGTWDWEGQQIRPIPPTGPRVEVLLVNPATGAASRPQDWVTLAKGGSSLADAEPNATFLFTGSQMVRRKDRELYRADSEGCIIGLSTFGGEVVGYSLLHSPEASMEEPDWIARRDRVPPTGTPIIVRVKRVP